VAGTRAILQAQFPTLHTLPPLPVVTGTRSMVDLLAKCRRRFHTLLKLVTRRPQAVMEALAWLSLTSSRVAMVVVRILLLPSNLSNSGTSNSLKVVIKAAMVTKVKYFVLGP